MPGASMLKHRFECRKKSTVGSISACVRRLAAGLLMLLLVVQGAESAMAQQTGPAQQSAQQAEQASLPESPAPAADRQRSDQSEQSTSAKQDGESQKPIGTAAAPEVNPVGVAGAKAAGAAIAPAKQRRAHSFVIKFALIAGAAAAGGAVVALTAGSRSRPQ
jgi:cytoskeletal protein RodZ